MIDTGKQISESDRLQVSILLIRTLYKKLGKTEKCNKKLENKVWSAKDYLHESSKAIECGHCDKWIDGYKFFCIKCSSVNCDNCLEEKHQLEIDKHLNAKEFCIGCLGNFREDDIERCHNCDTCFRKFYHKGHNMICPKCNSKNCSYCLSYKINAGIISNIALCTKCARIGFK